MTHPSSSRSRPRAARSDGGPIAGIWILQFPSGEEPRLDPLTPVEREGGRYGYHEAGRPFGPGREALERWLELRTCGPAG
jgi:hypothetical protein